MKKEYCIYRTFDSQVDRFRLAVRIDEIIRLIFKKPVISWECKEIDVPPGIVDFFNDASDSFGRIAGVRKPYI